MEAEEYYLLIEGETYGPYTLEQVQKLWHETQIPLDTLYIRKGMTEVRPLDEVINQVIAYQKPLPQPPAPPPLDSPAVARAKRIFRWTLVSLSVAAVVFSIKTAYFPEVIPPEPMSAGVTVSRAQIKVINNNHYAWTNRWVRLNDNGTEAFEYRIRRLEPGKTLNIPLVIFSRRGRHFESWREPVTNIWVSENETTFKRTAFWRE